METTTPPVSTEKVVLFVLAIRITFTALYAKTSRNTAVHNPVETTGFVIIRLESSFVNAFLALKVNCARTEWILVSFTGCFFFECQILGVNPEANPEFW